MAEVMVEGEDAMDFGARQIQRLRHHGDRRLRHVAERLLKGVKDDERRAFLPGMFGDDLGAARLVPRLCHSSFSIERPLIANYLESFEDQ